MPFVHQVVREFFTVKGLPEDLNPFVKHVTHNQPKIKFPEFQSDKLRFEDVAKSSNIITVCVLR